VAKAQLFAALAKRVGDALIGAGDVTVERHRDVEPEDRHGRVLHSGVRAQADLARFPRLRPNEFQRVPLLHVFEERFSPA
jgi:hypothetical protein